jgi:hypothetical protein
MQQAATYLSRAEGWDSWRKRGEAWRNFCADWVVDGDPDSDLDRIGIHIGRKPSLGRLETKNSTVANGCRHCRQQSV